MPVRIMSRFIITKRSTGCENAGSKDINEWLENDVADDDIVAPVVNEEVDKEEP